MPSQAAARRRARHRRLDRDPEVPGGGGLAARQRRDEIVEHLFDIGLAMQVTARQSMPALLPEPSHPVLQQLPRQLPPQLPQPVLQPMPRQMITAPPGSAESDDDTNDLVHRARLHVVRDGELPPPAGDVPLYTALSEIFAQDSARRTAADLAGARRHRPHRRPGRRPVVSRRRPAVPVERGGPGARPADAPRPAVRSTREERLVGALVTLADTPAAGDDLTDLMRYLVDVCAELLDAAGAAVVLAHGDGHPAVVASSGAQAKSLEALQLRTGRGPCWDCLTTGAVQSVGNIAAQAARWPQFAPLAAEQGVRSVHAVPLRMRSQTFGSLSVYRTTSGD